MSRSRLIALLFAVACAALVSGCSKSAPDTPPAAARTKIVVASEASFPPMEYIDDSGTIIGFDIDLIKAVAKEAGLEVEIQNVAWDGIFGALQSGNADLIASSVTITDDRKARFAFTRPYLKAGQVLLVRAADKDKYPDLKALSDKAVGVQMGTTGAEFMQKQGGSEVKQYNTAGLAIIDLANGNLEGVLIDKPVADYYATQKPEFAQKLHLAGAPHTEEQFGFVLRKDDKELLAKLDSALANVQANGTAQKIEDDWFR